MCKDQAIGKGPRGAARPAGPEPRPCLEAFGWAKASAGLPLGHRSLRLAGSASVRGGGAARVSWPAPSYTGEDGLRTAGWSDSAARPLANPKTAEQRRATLRPCAAREQPHLAWRPPCTL